MIKVWGRDTSSNVQKVMWCIGELGLEHERVDLGGPFGGNDQDWYLALNPNGRVPTIDDDGFVLWESNSIVRYLAAKHDGGGLSPADLAARADAERWMDWHSGTMVPPMTTILFGLYRTAPLARDNAAIAAAVKAAAGHAALLDSHLSDREFLCGERLTIADLALGVMAYRWHNFEIERPELANWRAYYDRLAARPAFQQHVMIAIS